MEASSVLEIKIRVEGSAESYTYPAYEPLPDTWILSIEPGENYKVVDNDIVKPAKDFKGTLKVGVILKANDIKSKVFEFDVVVK